MPFDDSINQQDDVFDPMGYNDVWQDESLATPQSEDDAISYVSYDQFDDFAQEEDDEGTGVLPVTDGDGAVQGGVTPRRITPGDRYSQLASLPLIDDLPVIDGTTYDESEPIADDEYAFVDDPGTGMTFVNEAAPTDQGVEPMQPFDGTYVNQDPASDEIALRNLEQRRANKRRKRRMRIIAACLVVAGAAGALAWHFMHPIEEENNEPVVMQAVVERMDFSNSVTATGVLKAGSTVIVTPEVDGVIESVHVSEGDEVKEGDVLFTLKNDDLEKAVHDAETEVSEAQRALTNAQTAVSEAQAARDEAYRKYNEEYARVQAAHEKWEQSVAEYDAWAARRDEVEALNPGDTQSLNPGNDPDPDGKSAAHKKWVTAYDRYMAALAQYEEYAKALNDLGSEPVVGVEPEYPDSPEDSSLNAAISDAQEGVESAQTALNKAQEAYNEAVANTEKRNVTAPKAGTIVAVGAKVGAAVGGASGDSSDGPLVQISDISKMAIDVEVNEVDILSVRKGQKVTATFSAVQGVEASGKVVEVAKVATGDGEMGVVTFHVGVVIPKPNSQLRPGMTANVEIKTEDVPDALVVPTAAISEGTDGSSVEVLVDEETGETETRMIEVGVRNTNETVVTDGLFEGETVVYTEGMGYEYE